MLNKKNRKWINGRIRKKISTALIIGGLIVGITSSFMIPERLTKEEEANPSLKAIYDSKLNKAGGMAFIGAGAFIAGVLVGRRKKTIMEYVLKTGRTPQTVNVYVTTKKPQRVRIVAVDANKPNTSYVNHGGMVNGSRKFELPLPQTPEQLKIYVYNEATAPKNRKKDTSVKVIKFGVSKLKTWNIWESAQTKDFVKFAQAFSENAGVMDTSEKPYASDNNQFKILYVDVIRGKDGKELTTPARISNKTGVIEVAKKYFKGYTVAMRMIILLHEYSHFYLNKVMRNEIQADLNGLYVYLGLGYSPIEAHRAFLTVFSAADTAQNDLRYQMIKKYVADFMTGGIASPKNHSEVQLRKAA